VTLLLCLVLSLCSSSLLVFSLGSFSLPYVVSLLFFFACVVFWFFFFALCCLLALLLCLVLSFGSSSLPFVVF